MILGEDYSLYECDNCEAKAYSKPPWRGASGAPNGWMRKVDYVANMVANERSVHLCPECASVELFEEILATRS